MTSVWWIEDGAYSNYAVLGVFSSEQNAHTALQELRSKTADIVEVTLDGGIDMLKQGLHIFVVTMCRDGSIESLLQPHTFNVDDDDVKPHLYKDALSEGFLMHINVWAKSEKHAIKVANEHRTMLVASGKWPGA
ncbi:MAG: hypothetical protein EPN91_02290 [Salinibacterium sp.]|nr:MAG: hypothetical protein EPN91_02290 [Salinibacterium sp.]